MRCSDFLKAASSLFVDKGGGEQWDARETIVSLYGSGEKG